MEENKLSGRSYRDETEEEVRVSKREKDLTSYYWF